MDRSCYYFSAGFVYTKSVFLWMCICLKIGPKSEFQDFVIFYDALCQPRSFAQETNENPPFSINSLYGSG